MPFLSSIALLSVMASSITSYGQYTLAPERFGVINVVPNNQSSESGQNSEPSLSVGTGSFYGDFVTHVFQPNNGADFYYTSVNGGSVWTAPGFVADEDFTSDWSTKGMFYAAFLTYGGTMVIETNFGVPGSSLTAIPAGSVTGFPDQPWVRAVTMPGGTDHIYIGFNDLSKVPGETASVHFSTNGGVSWATLVLDHGNTGNARQDAPEVRLAISPDGTMVYAMFERYTSYLFSGNYMGDYTGDVVLMRDDNSAGTFNALGTGTVVTNNITLPGYAYLGHERIDSDCDLAINPSDPNEVYVAYTLLNGFGFDPIIVVEGSLDGGHTFSTLYTTSTLSSVPSLAVLNDGTVGLLYLQRVATELQVVFSKAPQGDFSKLNSRILASWQNGLGYKFDPYVGDYFNLRAVGANFYGVFSAYNDPSQPKNFPCLAYYQRNVKFNGTSIIDHNFTLKVPGTLYNATATAPVTNSIDPFFFYDIASQWVPDTNVVGTGTLGSGGSSHLSELAPPSGNNPFVWPVLPADEPPLQLESSPLLGSGANWTIQSNNIIQTNGQFEFAPVMNQPSQFFRISQNVASGQFPIFTVADNNGSLSPGDLLTNAGFSSQTFTATPSNNYVVANWYLDGAVVASNTPTLTVSNISTEHTLLVTFEPTNDIAVSLTALPLVPGPALITNTFIYEVDIGNSGFATVTGVTMTNILDPNVSFVSATATQGTVTNSGNLVTADIGTLSNSASASVIITVIPNIETNITDTVNVACDQFEPDLANNTATATTSVMTPVSIVEDLTNEAASTGDTVTFSITTAGTPPIVYQWFFDGEVLDGATNASLTISNVTVANAGTYAVSAYQIPGPEDIEEADGTPATLTVDGMLVLENIAGANNNAFKRRPIR